ncbi:peptidylprolyl isomerase [Cyanobium sp. Aljojuca 7D2]|uniref:peptidylprolyl isomerase n=1 Tax=Cyanobium sp. Aljojuca 7D2 TaxID=2823698 RepID=UPI0020CD7EB6|nr:peptidylprolyl isomerase [Cyanobium sp. Aljojuca 7D2]MCP9891979.1 peptidylprolyl isomerase [Cyanobium sp. Aljojuca 7D2]
MASSPLDPRPVAWLVPERLQRLRQQLAPAAPLLGSACLLKPALNHWVRLELAQEVLGAPLEQAAQEQAELKQLVGESCLRWADQQWRPRLKSLYLERKAMLDRASCRLLRLSNKHLALEIYHRIRAGEASFESLATLHGEGPERLQGGLLPLQPMGSMPLGLPVVLQRLHPGELTMPQRLGAGFALVQLEQLQPACLDAATEQQLLSQELDSWVAAVVAELPAHLTSPQHSLVDP